MNFFNKLTIVFFSLIIIKCFASPQMPDFIIYKNDTIPTYNLILEKYLQKLDSEEQKQNSLFGLSFRNVTSTNCWRGYQAIYKIDNNNLYLVKIINCGDMKDSNDESSKIKMSEIFGDKVKNHKVLVDWYSGELNFPIKKVNNNLIRWDGVFYKIFEYETVLSFSKGKLIKKENVRNYEKVKGGISRENKKDVTQSILNELNKSDWNDEKFRGCEDDYIITIDKAGKVSRIKMNYPDDKIEVYYEFEEYYKCIKKIENNLKVIRFDIIKDKGKSISENIYLQVIVENNGKLKVND